MEDLDREDVARFLAAWRRAYIPMALVTPAVTKTIAALEALAADGGMLVVPSGDVGEPSASSAEALQPPAMTPEWIPASADDNIPF